MSGVLQVAIFQDNFIATLLVWTYAIVFARDGEQSYFVFCPT